MRYSYSSLKCFENCPQAFRFQYIDKIEVEAFESIEAFMGHTVHATLERFYNDLKSGVTAPVEDFLADYNDVWNNSLTSEVVVTKEGFTHEDYRLLGGRYLLDYYDRYTPFDGCQVVDTEMRVTLDLLGDGQYRLLGFLDRLDKKTDGIYEIHDYKTNGKPPSRGIGNKYRQLALYELGLRQMLPKVKEVDLVWHYLAFNKELRYKCTHEDHQTLKKDLLSTIHTIERAIVDDHFPAKKTGLCGWCQYQEICKTNNKTRNKQMKIHTYTK